MEYLHFSSLTEVDFDQLVYDAGGRRYTNDPRVKELNCDYILDDVVIELKIIEEEPIEKKEKQKKFIELFPVNAQTVILYPSEKQKYSYYKILESPIKKALKKASKQLQESAKNIGSKLKIAMIMNNGLYMVSQKEFLDIAINRAENDTSGIDILIVCSIHYYSDKFDMNIMFEFKDYEINNIDYEGKKQIIDKLRSSWNKKTEEYMITQLNEKKLDRNKKPIKDLYFEFNGVRYIKPNIQWGEPSEFWVNGRPREDTTKEDDLPIIWTAPIFNEKSYLYTKEFIDNKNLLQRSLNDYIELIKNNPLSVNNKIQLAVYVELLIEDLQSLKKPFRIQDIQEIANLKFETKCENIKNKMQEHSEYTSDDNYILVEVQEIGQDKANDIGFISHVNNGNQEWLVKGNRVKYEDAINLAISFCIVLNTNKVYYVRNEDFKWK